MRAVPTIPAIMMRIMSHHSALNDSMNENAMTLPVTPPMAAVWVDIFMRTLKRAQKTCTKRAATMMADMKCGMCIHRMML